MSKQAAYETRGPMMTISSIYIIGLVAMYLNGLMTFHLMKRLLETGHPNLYAMGLFPLTGIAIFVALCAGFGLARGLRLTGKGGLFDAQTQPIATVLALVAAVSALFAGYGLPMLLTALAAGVIFGLTFLAAGLLLK